MSSHGSYIPPFRRGDAQATGAKPDTPDSSNLPPNHSSSRQPFNNRGNRDNMSGRGFRGGRGRGNGRGRGTYGNQFSQNRNQDKFYDADFYSQRAIARYFSGGDEEGDGAVSYQNSSTFHNSKEHPDQLSYMLLFSKANPRWPDDRIVFAKSKLDLLPEYSAKKKDYGEWPSVKLPEDPQVSDATTDTTSKENIPQPATKDDEAGPVVTAMKSMSVTDEEKAEATIPSAATQTDETPVEEASSGSSSRMKYSDVRNLPPEEQERLANEQKQQRLKPQQLEFVFPSIPPIDYVPSAHPPIAAFEERRSYDYGYGNSRFLFAGWYRITHINLLAPHSAEVVRMQRQKWERWDRYGKIIPGKARDAAAWQTSLKMEWAVVKFEKIGDDEAPPVPDIEKLPKPELGKPADATDWRKGKVDGEGAVEKNLEEHAKAKEDPGEKGEKIAAAAGEDKKALAENICPEESASNQNPQRLVKET
ncbi:hypothetical protein K445DRAFT_318245 [Daldinia sp. EC12]|nr:hypothetical protein K445DRAFT_318245 [Daldinia sp. EC12]